jgi:hypothetical protein
MHSRAVSTFTRAVVLVTMLGVAACGSDKKSPTEGGNSSLVATWDIRSIDGQNLPFTETEDFGDGMSCSFTFASGFITFNSNGRYTSGVTVTFACTGIPQQTMTETSGGTWRTTGNQIFIKPDPDEDGSYEEDAATFTINGRILTIVSSDGVIVLERR